ncbi:HD domain-containing protein [Pinibacter soli]|uniref:HD domain-containing protein n=1 Tax=Pinibacter soli TaxID=3044211 RepID=A0ABT6RD84_9BACT|nr:HD domain-containing protein [Pinibacter soli]MDI3320361.1 HD domain-containing protein [Pinibacter soli]
MTYTNNLIEDILNSFYPVLGNDYEKYRNHVYRVFLNCKMIDNSHENEWKYSVAAVFHDIGIWTNNTIDYLQPSMEQAKNYLICENKQAFVDELMQMIYWHHKQSAYKGEYKTAEVFRKADYIDVSLGLITFGYSSKEISNIRKLLPNKGFHFFLIKRITKNLFKHPSNPLPMFTK